ncbi:MAG: hypothetical protein AB7Q81_14130 [Gammaproteobacteria bacterium]
MPPDIAARPAILDIEASGFGAHSYPIEIGVVLGDGWRYCSLIVPMPGWTHWDEGAERVHGITRETLRRYGHPAAEVARTLNDSLAGQTLYSDGWVVDLPWLRRLFFDVALEPSFELSPLERILDETQMARWRAVRDQVATESRAQRHRASSDAWVIQETWYRTRLESAA